MKNLLKVLFISCLMIFFTGLSCTKDKPLCETNNFGHVIIKNNTNISLWVDATSAGEDYNNETRLMPGSSYKFTVDPGTVTVWAASDVARQNNSWNYKYITVAQCDEYSFTWNSGKGISIESTSDGQGSYTDLKEVGKPKAQQ